MCRTQDGADSRSFPPAVYGKDPEAVSDGRRYVRTCLQELAAPAELTEVAVLLSSELLSNAMLHGSPPVSIQVHVLGGRVRVSVADAQQAVPARRDADATGGLGLHLLDRAAADWDYHSLDVGKCVWFELDLPPAPGRPL